MDQQSSKFYTNNGDETVEAFKIFTAQLISLLVLTTLFNKLI
jgi:hypothetical protein